jgi:hypothetical protein
MNTLFRRCSAGTGKSTVLKQLINMLPPATTFVTASTGVAAVNIGGITLHQFAVRLSQPPDYLQLHPLVETLSHSRDIGAGRGIGRGHQSGAGL